MFLHDHLSPLEPGLAVTYYFAVFNLVAEILEFAELDPGHEERAVPEKGTMARARTSCLLAGLLCVALWPAATHAQSPDLLDAYERFSEQSGEGHHEGAMPFAQKALRLAVREFGPDRPSPADFLSNLAGLYHAQRRYAAEPLDQRLLAVREKAEHLDFASSLSNRAALYHDQGRYAEAEPLYERALAIWEKVLGPDHPGLARGLNNLAALYRAQGRYAEAEPLYRRALANWEKALGPEHPYVVPTLQNYAALLRELGREAEAAEMEARAEANRGKAAEGAP